MDYLVIKENDAFLLTDSSGNIPENHPYGLGFYKKDTRFLSKLDIVINDEAPILLAADGAGSHTSEIRLTNPHIEGEGKKYLWRESVEIKRNRFIYQDVLYENVTLKNYSPKTAELIFKMVMDTDFNDMFIVRGFQTGNTGAVTERKADLSGYIMKYAGADDVDRTLTVKWSEEADRSGNGFAEFDMTLGPQETRTITFTFSPEVGEEKLEILPPEDAKKALDDLYQEWQEKVPKVETDHERLQALVDQGLTDMRVLQTDIGHGPFPVAGLPWFAVPFGRDSLIAAWQMLMFNPETAKGTLQTMAAYQGKTLNAWRDEQPGKIMHEIRFGELAGTGQIPFTPYYGSVDSTPLFLVLLVEYVNWTGDFNLFEKLKPNVEAALEWIEVYGDRDGDGFTEYYQESEKGIANQGWKDSGDSVVHRNGDYGKPPIALIEVQGYIYQAKKGLADLYKRMNESAEAEKLNIEAGQLFEKLQEAFWMEDLGFYAMALDQDKAQVGSLTSNPGHLLFSEAAPTEKADQIIDKFVSEALFSGYGIRTMAEGETGYNPMSYHDGSIWPHDNSLIIHGMSVYGRQKEAAKVMNGLIEASRHFNNNRLPELFCGYTDELGYAVRYPVACSPQAWAAGTPLVFIRAMLGLTVDLDKGFIKLQPQFIDGMKHLKIDRMPIGHGTLSFTITEQDGTYNMAVEANSTGLDVNFIQTHAVQ